MASPRNIHIPGSSATSPWLEEAAVQDATNDITEELEALTTPLAELAQAARQCFEDRVEYDMGYIGFQPIDEERERKRLNVEDKLEIIRDQAEAIKAHRDAIRAQLPPSRWTYTNSTIDPWIAQLDKSLLDIELQKLTGVLGIIGHVDVEFTRARVDLLSVQDLNARSELKAALDQAQDALFNFRKVYAECGEPRSRTITYALATLDGWSPMHEDFSLGSPAYSIDDTTEDSSSSSGSVDGKEDAETLATSISQLSLDPFADQEEEEEEEDDDEEEGEDGGVRLITDDYAALDRPFEFYSGHPPTLKQLASWLGLVDTAAVALLLNGAGIRDVFETYRGHGAGYAEDPRRLKLTVPLFTFSRDTLVKWEGHMGRTPTPDSADFGAALFANHVVRFLEGPGCPLVDWAPVRSNSDGHIHSLRDYEVARRRWAVALQIFWFLEVALA
ncbi:hypothetical protein F5X98DRAFT_390261 [Xylaria grammica]|nr:hypothetical protein F5X98DRAFT_390261 [Xylaria grammica]